MMVKKGENMGLRAALYIATVMMCAFLPGLASAQNPDVGPVQAAAAKFSGTVTWRESTVLIADFNCTGKVQFAILGGSAKEIAVAIFSDGLDHSPALLRFKIAR